MEEEVQTEFMTCGMCGHQFTAEESASACARCSLFGAGGCHKVRCPRCGYEMAPPARMPQLIKKVMRKITGHRAEMKDTTPK